MTFMFEPCRAGYFEEMFVFFLLFSKQFLFLFFIRCGEVITRCVGCCISRSRSGGGGVGGVGSRVVGSGDYACSEAPLCG